MRMNMNMIKTQGIPFNEEQILANLKVQSIEELAYVTINAGDRWLYAHVCKYIEKNSSGGQCSYVAEKKRPDPTSLEDVQLNGVTLNIGLGLFDFEWNGVKLFALHQRVGEPVGTMRCVKVFCDLVVFIKKIDGDKQILEEFCQNVLQEHEKTKMNHYKVFHWDNAYQYWQYNGEKVGRPWESIVLPKQTKDTILKDMNHFESMKTKKFYLNHGIPYRRSYLFYGVAGCGKSSLLTCLAAKYKRNICFIQPTHEKSSDDSLKQAMVEVPDRSIIVLEDVDALFDENRKKKIEKSNLTFSGLLNALDGLSSPNGQVIILTSNYRERLDKALIRQGRVDLHIEFQNMQKEEIETMFGLFYPDQKSILGKEFAEEVVSQLSKNDLKVSGAGLQHFFVLNMNTPPEKCIEKIDEIIQELKSRNIVEKEIEAKEKKEKDDEEKKTKKDDVKSETPINKPAAVDFHLHLHKE